jgi:hypothetical protein
LVRTVSEALSSAIQSSRCLSERVALIEGYAEYGNTVPHDLRVRVQRRINVLKQGRRA